MQKTLIVLQENTGQVALPPNLPPSLATAVTGVIDTLAETFEDIKSTLQGSGRYDQVILLTDALCVRGQLLNTLIDQAKKGRIIDLLILGHGSSEYLQLHGESLTNATIRTLSTDAQRITRNKKFSLNLRMVFMCNCYGSTLNDDWLAIGAQASVGSRQNDYMPEPMITRFVNLWLSGQTVGQAAQRAYSESIPFYSVVYPPTLRPRTKTVQQNVKYLDMGTKPPSWKTKTVSVQVPDGVDVIPHPYICETELLVGGNSGLLF